MRKFALTISVTLLALVVGVWIVFPRAAQAQTAAATPTLAAALPSNDTTAFFVVCNDQSILNLTGTSLVGWDVYYQVFNSPTPTGTALSGVRRVSVAGTYSVSDRFVFPSGQTVAAGATASARVWVGRETNPDTIDYEFTISDFNDGCAEPQYTLGTSTESGTTTEVEGPTGPGFSRSIFAPNGLLNPNLSPENPVVIGARPSDTFRSDTPGLIFAECDAYPLAIPGLIYDSDRVQIFWSWFTRTPEQMQQHLANAQYAVTLNTATLSGVNRTDIVKRTGSVNNWVFWFVDVGNLRPGHYEVSYSVTWAAEHFDGYDDYGPGTANPVLRGLCNFDVVDDPNTDGIAYNGSFFPTLYPVHELNPDY